MYCSRVTGLLISSAFVLVLPHYSQSQTNSCHDIIAKVIHPNLTKDTHKMEQAQPAKHTVSQSILLHLLPGALIACFYFLTRQPLLRLGYPGVFALTLAVIFVLIPFELGFLLYQGKKMTGRFTLAGVVSYCNAVPWWQFLLWTVGVLLVTGLVFTLMKPVDNWLKDTLFAWMPAMDMGLNGEFSRTALIVTSIPFFIFVSVLGPLVEELYFRGYLLPRLPGKLPELTHSLLFAVYHFFTPWMFVTRTLGLLPIVVAAKKKSIYIGIVVHILVNTLDAVTALLFILHMA